MRRLAALLLLVIPLSATTVTPMSIERLTQASTHVVLGEALDSRSAWNAQHTQIFTYTRFRISRVLKGTASSMITVKQMGGRADGYEQKVAGVRQLQSGETAVLFVHPSQAADGTMVVTGLMQGKFSVSSSSTGEATVTNNVPGVDQVHRPDGAVEHYSGTKMTLSTLEAIVRQAQQKVAK